MILDDEFFRRDCPVVARELVGKLLCTDTVRLRISETEAYCGEDDTACHAHRGRTARTEVFYADGGTIYVYLCYGLHWMLNIVTGQKEQPQAVLIRACVEAAGPAKLTKKLGIDKRLNGKSIFSNSEVRIEDDGFVCGVKAEKRVGIDYASPEDKDRPLRYVMNP